MSNNFILWNPSTFHPDDSLPLRLQVHSQSARYLMHCIVSRIAFDFEERDFARLRHDYLRNVIGRYVTDDIVTAMIDAGEITRVSNYSSGRCPYGYRPGKQYNNDKLQKFRPTHPGLIERLSKVRKDMESEQRQRHQPFHDLWQDWQSELAADGRQAKQAIAQLPTKSNPYGVQDMLVERIRQRQWRFSLDDYGRIHNAITSLCRTVRPALRIDGQRVGSVDIVNSQPALLALMLNGQRDTHTESLSIYVGTSFTPLAGFFDYRRLAKSGRLYEHLMDTTGLSRGDVKVGLLRDVFGKRGRYPSAVEQAFRESFPDVWAFVRRFNRDDHGALLKQLQRIESELVIHRIGQRLTDQNCGPCVSLHDSVFCRIDRLDRVREAFHRQFDEMDFQMRLKTA